MTQTQNLYIVFDRAAKVYAPPFVQQNDVMAYRSFVEAVTSAEGTISQYPADFDLLRIGSIDLDSGVLTPQDPPGLMVNGLVALTAAQQERQRYQAILSRREDGEASL